MPVGAVLDTVSSISDVPEPGAAMEAGEDTGAGSLAGEKPATRKREERVKFDVYFRQHQKHGRCTGLPRPAREYANMCT